MIKPYLSKAYHRVSCLYLRFMLFHVGFFLPLVDWIDGCIILVTLALLINGFASPFFTPNRGLR